MVSGAKSGKAKSHLPDLQLSLVMEQMKLSTAAGRLRTLVSLLSCGIPNREFHLLILNLNYSGSEFDADCQIVHMRKLIARESEQKAPAVRKRTVYV